MTTMLGASQSQFLALLLVVLVGSLVATTVHGLSSPAVTTRPKPTTTTAQEKIISLPLKDSAIYLEEQKDFLVQAFNSIVDDSDFMEQQDTMASSSSACRIPALSEDLVIDFYFEHNSNSINNNGENTYQTADSMDQEQFVLHITNTKNTPQDPVSATPLSKDDFGFLLAKFYDQRDKFDNLLDLQKLRQHLVDHHNQRPPHPGFEALDMRFLAQNINDAATNQLWDRLSQQLPQLEQQGYTVVDTHDFQMTEQLHARLSQYLVETTGDNYRSDKVHFLTQTQAQHAGLSHQYEMLMGIASFLNSELKFKTCQHSPIAPASSENPLTLPGVMQLAEYGQGDFFSAHSDNSWVVVDGEEQANANNHNGMVRRNFRHYTCILYGNDLDPHDGGALRLWLDSSELTRPRDAIDAKPYVDVNPKNGRLLIFESTLVHSVEPVHHPTKIRRALTLWIYRPNDSGVPGESYF